MTAPDAPVASPIEDQASPLRSVRNRDDAVALAMSLARPVVRGLLPIDHAEAALVAAIGRAWRLRLLDEGTDPTDLLEITQQIFALHVETLEDQRDHALAAILRTLRPMIASREPIGALRAAAFDVNAERHWLLTDQEIEAQVVFALHLARARLRRADSAPFGQRKAEPTTMPGMYHGGR